MNRNQLNDNKDESEAEPLIQDEHSKSSVNYSGLRSGDSTAQDCFNNNTKNVQPEIAQPYLSPIYFPQNFTDFGAFNSMMNFGNTQNLESVLSHLLNRS